MRSTKYGKGGKARTSGISLVALVITIIVLIILTGAVVVTFMDGGIIEKANEAVFKNDIRTYQDKLIIKKSEKQLEVEAGKETEAEINETEFSAIKELIPEMKDKYENLLIIVDGEFKLGSEMTKAESEMSAENIKYKGWLTDLGITGGEVAEEPTPETPTPEEPTPEEPDNTDAKYFRIENNVLKGLSDEYDGKPDLVVPEGVTTIGANAFYAGYDNGKYVAEHNSLPITSLTLPSTLQTIEEHAFDSLPITSITIPEGVTTIGKWSFLLCSQLQSVTLPNTLRTIDEGAFEACSSLTTIDLPIGLSYIEAGAFKESGLRSIELKGNVAVFDSAFEGCINLSNLSIGSGVSWIGPYAFKYCTSLETVYIPNSVTDIGAKAFENCASSLKLIFSQTSLVYRNITNNNITKENYATGWGVTIDQIEFSDSYTG